MSDKTSPILDTKLILSGLGLADRRSLSDLLAFLRDETAWKQIGDLFAGMGNSLINIVPMSKRSEIDIFQERLKRTSDEIEAGPVSDDGLRLLLWMLLRDVYGLPPELTFSQRGTSNISRDLGARMAEEFFRNEHSDWRSGLPDWLRELAGKRIGSGSFADMVNAYVLAQLSSLLSNAGDWTEQEREAALQELWEKLCSSDGSVEAGKASAADKEALIKAMGTGGSIGMLAILVEAAGFKAYILAAQAASIIPLVGSKTMVSLLAVVVNPVVVIPAVFFGFKWAKTSTEDKMMRAFGSIAGATLAMIGLRDSEAGAEVMVSAFERSESLLPELINQDSRVEGIALRFRERVNVLMPGNLGLERKDDGGRFAHPIFRQSDGENRVSQFLEGLLDERKDAVVLTGLSVGDFLYHTAMVDPKAVAAADFSSAGGVDGIFDFAVFSDRLREATGRSLIGAEQRLKGYVAEEMVAHRLIENGHVVQFPEAANQPGYDLIVDGLPMQVKCREDLHGLAEHFEKYPDIPVFANSELHGQLEGSQFEWTNQIYFVEGFSDEYVTQVTQQSLDAASDLLDNEVPVMAASLAAARNVLGWWKGQISPNEIVWTTATDVVGKGGIALIGGYVGSAVGLLLLGPAGAVIAGPVGGIFGAGKYRELSSAAGQYVDEEAKSLFEAAVASLARKCIDVLDQKASIIREKQSQLGAGAVGSFTRGLMDDDLQFIAERRCDLDRYLKKMPATGRGLQDIVIAAAMRSNVHPALIQNELLQVQKACNHLEKAVPRKVRESAGSLWIKTRNVAVSATNSVKATWSSTRARWDRK